ncbi:unnamed protein product [Effrenium voratum]|nr:unnamed protein product [Effrenium voratum]
MALPFDGAGTSLESLRQEPSRNWYGTLPQSCPAIEWQDNLLHAFQNSAKEEPSLGKSRCCWKLLASSASKRLLDAHPFVRHSDMPSGCARFLLHARCPLQTTCKENKQSDSRVWQNTMQSYFVYWTSAMTCKVQAAPKPKPAPSPSPAAPPADQGPADMEVDADTPAKRVATGWASSAGKPKRKEPRSANVTSPSLPAFGAERLQWSLRAMSKRVWKLQDFVAQTGSDLSRVQCARLGEKSGQVLATGGDDKRVNIWKVGKPNAIISLTGHTSAVECLVFDKQEEVLVVGCAGGSMQCWNLEYRKMAGSLPGHRAACTCVEFHPYGEFFASGSNDTNLKIWDLRRKSCIQTYPGHSAPVSAIRFSPHGRWVATGGLDNQVKIWDLTAGKQMKDLDLHKGAVTSLAFHPKEYLLDMRLCYPDEKLLAVTAEGSQLGIWVADLRREKVVGRPRGNAGRVSPTQAPPGPIDAEEATSSYAEVAAEVKAAAAAAMERVHHFREGGDAMPEPPRRPVERRPDRPVERPLENPARAPMERAPMERAPMERAERTERPERPDSPGPPQVEAKSPQSSYNGLRAPVAPVAPMEPPVASPPVSRPETRLDMDTIATQHPQMLGVLKRRLEQTRRLTELWAQGNFSSIGSVLTMPQDQAVLCDLARGLMRKDLGSALTLDACWAFLPLLKELLLTSKYEDFIATALEFTELLLGQFGNLISETRESCARIPERQLDLAREQRMRKCSSCYEHFKEIHQLLVAGPSAARFGKLNSSLQAFIQRGERMGL